ncbi:MAG: phosphoglucomutase/phosphomannomutase PgmG [Alphaproteobacteria bacterium]
MTGTGHQFHPSILREYDIRGVVGQTLFPADARAVGRTLGSVVSDAGGTAVCVGYDGRLSSPEMAEQVTAGFLEAGIAVLRLGLVPTPAVYFAARLLGMDGGLMVTGSHNPPDHNGFKMVVGNKPFWGKAIKDFGVRAGKGAWVSGKGKAVDVDILGTYVTRLLVDYRETAGLKVAWDAGNGAMGPAMAALAARLPGEHVLLNAEVDGTFPSHHPDPTVPENLEQLQEAVIGQGCALGIAFDGDGDRIGVVDGQGRILWGDQLLAILSADLLKRRPGATIIADVKASQVLFDEIARNGGNPVMAPTGHSIIKSRMADLDAPLAGEMSGHIFYGDRYYGFDDALYAAVRLLDILVRSGRSLAELRDALPSVVNTPEVRFAVPEERKFAIVAEVLARLKAEGADVIDVDGARVRTADGWWLLRASNTQAVLVARCEAGDAAGIDRLRAMLTAQLAASGVELPAF